MEPGLTDIDTAAIHQVLKRHNEEYNSILEAIATRLEDEVSQYQFSVSVKSDEDKSE